MNLQKIAGQLIDRPAGPKLTMVIPMHPKSRSDSLEQDRIRLKNSLRVAHDNVDAHDEKMQITLSRLEAQFQDIDFLKNQSRTLLVYADREDAMFVHLDHEFSELTHCGDEFILTPLLIASSIGTGMYVLHCTTENPALYFYDNEELAELDEISLPHDLVEALNIDEFNKDKQHHVGTGRGGAMHHGQGGAKNRTDDIDVFFSRLANALSSYFAGKDVPLLLVGVKDRIAYMRNHLSYPHIFDQELEGNYQHLNTPELLGQLRSVFTDIIEEDISAREESVKQLGDDIKAANPTDITEASNQGQIKDLYLSVLRKTRDSVRAGYSYDFMFDINKLDLPAVEKIVRKVVAQGGKIHAVTTNGLGSLQQLAVLRYTTA